MVSLGFATCLQELLSDHRARSFLEHREKLLNYFHLRNLSKINRTQLDFSLFTLHLTYGYKNRKEKISRAP